MEGFFFEIIYRENSFSIYFLQRSFEFEVQIPLQTILSVQIWDWDMTSSNDMIAETKLDIENRWFSSHRATCGLPKRYDRFNTILFH